ncbi:MAG: N-acetylmuramoyl-L-alanine amidase [Dethiobacter sp.]|nr:N-acetylmuramoyl-L-alanine amidase [Dethiobacter sp.]
MEIVESNLVFSAGRVERRLSRRRSTQRIAIHHTASGDVSAETVHGWHRNRGWMGIGYHYLVRQAGEIERGRAEELRGIHAPAANANSIAIALAGNFELLPPAVTQMNSLVWLIRDIRSRHGELPLIRHLDLQATSCPGRLFPWEELQRRLQQRTHLVVRGDTLFSLARKYGVTVEQLRQWNNLQSGVIRVGQLLVVSQNS